MPDPIISVSSPQITVRLEATFDDNEVERKNLWFDWAVKHPVTKKNIGRLDVSPDEPWIAHWHAAHADIGPQDVTLTLRQRGPDGEQVGHERQTIHVTSAVTLSHNVMTCPTGNA
jgi:hypothetical protein